MTTHMNEVNGLLTEKEVSLKRKIFSLPKMEALVHPDPKLSAVYNEMAEDGVEKYGYHYNETIMNIIFNDYVLNSPKYLQKYKMAIPKKKKRRDKSGIHQLRKDAEKKIKQSKRDNKSNADLDETTTTGSVGGDGMGSGGYATPYAWGGGNLSKGTKKQKLQTQRRPIWQGGSVIGETNYIVNVSGFKRYYDMINEWEIDDIDFIKNNSDTYGNLGNMGSNDLKIIKGDIKRKYIDDVSDNISLNNLNKKKTNMSSKNKVNEDHLNNDEDKVMFIIKSYNIINPNDAFDKGLIPMAIKHFMSFGSDRINALYNMSEKTLRNRGIDPKIIDINNNELSEETDQSMIGISNDTMANKSKPEGDLGGGMTMGMSDSGGLGESDLNIDGEDDDIEFEIDLDDDDDIKNPHKIDWERVKNINKSSPQRDKFTSYDGTELFEEINEELETFTLHHNKLKSIAENKKHPSMINLDRRRVQNKANTKENRKNSSINDIINMEKSLMWKDQQIDVSKNPHKMGEEIEKNSIKNALKNVGNSEGGKGEIPKRNVTSKEQEEIDEYRLGQQDLVYDNKPSKTFEKRMKVDMGDDLYGKRQKNLKKRAEYPMYNKESQPVQYSATKKTQFNKNKSGWNDRVGLKETFLTGKYVNDLNNNKIIDFKLDDVNIVESVKNLYNVDLSAMGNLIDGRGNVNEAVNSIINDYSFYTDGKTIVAQKKPIQNINENYQNKSQSNNGLDKMKHLLNYNPKGYISTKNNKI